MHSVPSTGTYRGSNWNFTDPSIHRKPRKKYRSAGRFAEQDVVIRVGIERRVEINEVNAGVGKFLWVAQPLEIVAEKEAVHWLCI
jgi:hypothetical protein